MIIAQRFIAGTERRITGSPEGTVEWHIQPSLWDFTLLCSFPSDKSLGYFQAIPDGTKNYVLTSGLITDG